MCGHKFWALMGSFIGNLSAPNSLKTHTQAAVWTVKRRCRLALLV